MTNISLSKLRKLPYDARLKMAVAQNSLDEIHTLMKEHSQRDHEQAEQYIIDHFGVDGVLKTVRLPICNFERLCQFLVDQVKYIDYSNHYMISPTIFIGNSRFGQIPDNTLKIIFDKNMELYKSEDERNIRSLAVANIREFVWHYPRIINDKEIIDVFINNFKNDDVQSIIARLVSFSKDETLRQYIKDCLVIHDIIV